MLSISSFNRFPHSLLSWFNNALINFEVRNLDPQDGGNKPFVHLRCPGYVDNSFFSGYRAFHINSLIVAISSICRFTRSGDTETAHGVYFGHENPHNVDGHIDEWDDFRPSPRREHGGQWDCSDDPEQPPCVVKHVIFKTDSRGLVETVEAARNGEDPLTRDFVWKGFVTYSPLQSHAVSNKDMWDVLVEKLTEMFNAVSRLSFGLFRPRGMSRRLRWQKLDVIFAQIEICT